MVSRTRPVHRCTACGAVSVRWSGRCPSCDAWNSLVEEVAVEEPARGRKLAAVPAGAGDLPVSLSAVDVHAAAPRPTGLAELDRVLGGGIVPGSAVLIGGEPGIGKSTL
ncbi:MAG TPA: DNA repair protein RadA, partial [Acidimicrobiales bacterium]|nr:DNA repair protein RadA [Acidimicrobiales bacterium]